MVALNWLKLIEHSIDIMNQLNVLIQSAHNVVLCFIYDTEYCKSLFVVTGTC